ncbi:MAG: hypothetical protein ACI4VQ_07545 [Clostridia bacterium]
MSKEEKYKYLAIMLLKRLVVLEKETSNLQKKLEETYKENIINFSLEIKDIIPFKEIIEFLEADDKIFGIFTDIIENYEYKNLDKEIEKIFNIYIT